MKKFVLGGVALAAMLATPAMAADMPVKARPVPPPVCYDWSGFYIGAHAGYLFGEADLVFTEAVQGSPAGSGVTVDLIQPFVGFQGGIQYQFGCSPFGNFVFGVEAFWSITHENNERVSFVSRFPGEALRANVNEFGGAGVRLGWAFSGVGFAELLFTVSGGWAAADIQTGNFGVQAAGCNGIGTHCAMDTHNHQGWYVGAALEAMVAKGPFVDFIVGVEYKYFALDSQVHCEVVFTAHCFPLPAGPVDRKEVEADFHTIRVTATIKTPGFGFLFGGP